jgi:drug/metabolite transporter (DMT)-like permease
MVLAAALFAVMNLLVHVSSVGLPWAEVGLARALVGALVAVTVARRRGVSLELRSPRLAWGRSIAGSIAMLCTFFTVGAPTLALGDAVTLGATSTIFIALLSPPLLGESSGRSIWIATPAAFVGVALIAGPRFALAGHVVVVGLLGAIFTALAMISLRRLGGAGASKGAASAPDSPEAIVVHFSLVAAGLMFLVALPSLRVPDVRGTLLLVGTGVAGGLAQIAMTRAYSLERAAKVGVVGNVIIVFSHALGVAFLDELPTARQGLGALLVVSASMLIGLSALREARADVVRTP